MISPNAIMGMLVYRTREALNGNEAFIASLGKYAYYENCYVDGQFLFWHYPGTKNEISNALLTIGEHPNGARAKFPAMLNYQPVKQKKNGLSTTLYYNLAIAGSVLSDWTTEERDVQVFEPLLRPVYAEFIRQVTACGYFKMDYGYPAHNYYEVFTTGKNMTDLEAMYGDHIDAIELHSLELTLRSNLCAKDLARIADDNAKVTKDINKILNF